MNFFNCFNVFKNTLKKIKAKNVIKRNKTMTYKTIT